MTDTARADRAVERAIELACLLRDEGVAAIKEWIWAEPDPVAVLCAAAAMIDVDRSPRDLLAWSDGCLPFDDDLDSVAVDRAVAGVPVTLTRQERVEATRRLTAAGESAATIAERLRVDPRSVVRYRVSF